MNIEMQELYMYLCLELDKEIERDTEDRDIVSWLRNSYTVAHKRYAAKLITEDEFVMDIYMASLNVKLLISGNGKASYRYLLGFSRKKLLELIDLHYPEVAPMANYQHSMYTLHREAYNHDIQKQSANAEEAV